MRNRYLVNGVLNQCHPVGKKHDPHANPHQDRKQNRPSEDCPHRTAGIAVVSIHQCDPKNGTGEQDRSKNQSDVVRRCGRQADQ